MTSATQPDLSGQLDRLTLQVDWMAEQMRRQQLERQKWSELAETMTPITRDIMDAATREMDDLSADVTSEDLARFARTAARSIPRLEALLLQLEALSELAEQLAELSGPIMAKLTEAMQTAESKGYFAYAAQAAVMADNVVTEFTEDDVKALGDNVVTILHAVKEMTQPEVMGLLQRTALSVQDAEDHPVEPPSMFALLKQMRDPQTKRGLARALSMLHTMGEETEVGGPPVR